MSAPNCLEFKPSHGVCEHGRSRVRSEGVSQIRCRFTDESICKEILSQKSNDQFASSPSVGELPSSNG